MEKRLQTGLLIALTAAQYLIPASAIAQQPDSATVSLSEVVVTGSDQAVRRSLLPYTVTTVDHAALNATGTSEVLTAISGMVPSFICNPAQHTWFRSQQRRCRTYKNARCWRRQGQRRTYDG